MDKLKIKHNHKLTDILKVLIFSIVMMAPLFSIATRCLYVICNRNAKDSYTTDYTINEMKIGTYTTSENETIVLSYNNNTSATANFIINNFANEFDENINTIWNQPEGSIPTNLQIMSNGQINLMYNGAWINKANLWGITIFEITFKSKNGASIATNNNMMTDAYVEKLINSNTLDNAFDYSIKQISESQTFNWTTNTGIYTTINAMFTGLEMPSNNALAIMLTYWMICMLIYLVIDIIVALITKMTHLFNE